MIPALTEVASFFYHSAQYFYIFLSELQTQALKTMVFYLPNKAANKQGFCRCFAMT
jgi:hypothetical protein